MTDPAVLPRRYLVDTNILVAISLGDAAVIDYLANLERTPAQFFIGLQNLCEFWNVCTRPTANNGLGRSPRSALHTVDRIRTGFQVLAETDGVTNQLVGLLRIYAVRGKQIYDARLTALLLAHGLDGILTFNALDFVRYTGANPIHPMVPTL